MHTIIDYFANYFFDELSGLKNVRKYWKILITVSRRSDYVLNCLVVTTIQWYSIHCHGEGEKPENIQIKEAFS